VLPPGSVFLGTRTAVFYPYTVDIIKDDVGNFRKAVHGKLVEPERIPARPQHEFEDEDRPVS
jgi:hypothetical protein